MISSAIYTQMIIFLCTFLLSLSSNCCSAKDNITTGDFIHDGRDYLESSGRMFQMGFFPHNTSEIRRYVGIWYTMDPKTIVWVANRDNPLLDSTGVFTVSEDGKVKVLNQHQKVYFSTPTGAPLTVLKLLDTGNAILLHVPSGNILWESFLNPTDTFLPGMKMDQNIKLTSWKSLDDPGSGSFVFHQDPGDDRYSILNGTTTNYWKSGNQSKNSFDQNQIFSQAYYLLSNTTTQIRNIIFPNGTRSNQSYSVIDPYSRLIMNYTGNIQYFSWQEGENSWVLYWKEPNDACSIYRACGSFGMCNQNKKPLCSCLPGFEPASHYVPGCKRTSAICESNNDKFLNLTMISIDDTTLPLFKSQNESACIKKCLEDCQCLAYSYIQNDRDIRDESRDDTQGCWIWNLEPNNLHANGLRNISIRVPEFIKGPSINTSSEQSNPEKKSTLKRVLVLVIVVSTLVLSSFCGIGYILYKRLVTQRESTESNQRNRQFQLSDTGRRIKELLDLDHSREEDREVIDVPYFELESIMAATDDFSEENKLGQGGFGPVYKGTLPGGLEIAIKRLSSPSGQGLQEFKNEVVLIAKLQHRNLVRLLGYCIRGEEKILLYEYMPNRSLDTFIFDQNLRTSVDWTMRLNIIMGIARGLDYLHHGSRLRIIHRDLKTSNILLDEDMNPKISDFGLAKIVKGNDMEAMTNRVVGTFGYMSPEYALDGLFSVKSDVFSFGVVMLEIVSGKRNTGFYQSRRSISLLGHAWSLWIEDKPLELMDQILMESCNSNEVLKCITVGLLCVQGDPDDRPTMSNVILMLGGDITTLSNPKEPAFVSRRDQDTSSSSTSSKLETQTRNTLTITKVEGR